MNIGDLIWEQNGKVMKFLFAKINSFVSRKFSQISRPLVPGCVVSDGGEKKKLRNESKLQDPSFITWQIPLSDSFGEMMFPNILERKNYKCLTQGPSENHR